MTRSRKRRSQSNFASRTVSGSTVDGINSEIGVRKNSESAVWGWAFVFALTHLALLLVVFSPGYQGPFLGDDEVAIVENESIRDLTDWREIAFPKTVGGSTHEGRPLLNLTFAVNYAMSSDPLPFKVTNVVIHWLAGCALIGLAFWLIRWQGAQAKFSLCTSGAIGLVWTLHPVTVQSVSYVAQRAESMASGAILLSVLLSLMALNVGSTNLSGFRSNKIRRFMWVSSVATVYLGVLCKEIVVVTPAVIFLIDWLLVHHDPWTAILQRYRLYLAQLPALGLAGVLLVSNEMRGGTVGSSGAVQVGKLEYFLTQLSILPHYLRVSFVPTGLAFDHGIYLEHSSWKIAFGALVFVLILVSSLAFWRRWPLYSCCALIYLVVLSPTSTFIPIASQTVSEHRLYLPVACVVSALVWLGATRLPSPSSRWFVLVPVVLVLFMLTYQRAGLFQSKRRLWADTLQNAPYNRRAYATYIDLLFRDGDHRFASQTIWRLNENPENDLLSAVFLARVEYERRDYRESLRLCLRARELLMTDSVNPHDRYLFPSWAKVLMAESAKKIGLMDANGNVIRSK